MAREYKFSSPALERNLGRAGLGKLRRLRDVITRPEGRLSIRDVNSKRNEIVKIYKQLGGVHMPTQRQRLIVALHEASTEYVRNVEQLKRFQSDMIGKLEGLKKELESEDEVSGKGEIERLRQRNKELVANLGWGSLESRMNDVAKALKDNESMHEGLKKFISTDGFDQMKGVQDDINSAYQGEAGHAYSKYDRMTVEAIAKSHEERRDFHSEMADHHTKLADEIHRLGVIIGLKKEKPNNQARLEV